MIRALVVAAALAVAPESLPQPEGGLVFAALSVDAAERLAIADSPDVRAADAIVGQNAAAVAAARSALGPSAYANYNLAPQGVGTGTESQRLTSYGLQTTFGDILSYAPQIASARAGLRAAEAQRDATVASERIKVAGLYFDALKARAVSHARRSASRLAAEQLRAAEIRFAAGDAPRLDVVRADVAVARADADEAAAGAADANASEALTVETGVADRAVALTTPAVAESAPLLEPAEAVARALAGRSDIVAANATTQAAQLAARTKNLGRLPSINVQGGYTTGVDSGILVGGPQLSVNATLPLGGAARANAEQQAAVVAEDRARADALVRQIRLNVAAAARNVAAAERATNATQRARRAAGSALEATQLGYGRGYSSSFELAGARDAYTQAVVDELSARYDEAKARATLAIEVGGS